MADDPWASVEGMLRWRIELARTQISNSLEQLPRVGELYSLPKAKPGAPPHGRPEQWAFGALTPHEVSLANAVSRLRWAAHELDKAEESLARGDLPSSINWIILANQSISAALAQWHSGAAIAMWRYVGKRRKTSSQNAQKSRGEIGKIIKTLAISPEHAEDSAKELWPHLFSALDREHKNPEEVNHATDLKKCCIWYDYNDRRKTITFGQFSNKVSAYRTGKKSG